MVEDAQYKDILELFIKNYDVEINEETAKYIGLKRPSVIKTTKIYTGSRQKLGCKIGDLTDELKKKFMCKYREYQENIMNKWN